VPAQSGYWTAFYRGNQAYVWCLLALCLVFAALPWFVVPDDDEVPVAARMVHAILVALIYFVPALVALRRRHPGRMRILVFNLLLGLIPPVWVALLVWAMTPPGETTLV